MKGQFESAIDLGKRLPESPLYGTGRFTGTGGIMGSVGGDLSNLSTNPAGIGMFSRSEFEFSPAFQVNNVNTNYQYLVGNTTAGSSIWDQNQYRFVINSMGAVFAFRRSENSPLRSSNIALAINRTNNFNRVINFGADNSAYTYSQYLSDYASDLTNNPNSGFPDPNVAIISSDFYSLDNTYNRILAARSAQLINYDNSRSNYIDPLPYKFPDNPYNKEMIQGQVLKVYQGGSKTLTGGTTELSIGWSASIQDKLYVGVSLGIPFTKYRAELTLNEDNAGNTYAVPSGFGPFNRYVLTENDYFSGTGINLKLGLLYKLDDHFKISGFIHTPTYYQFDNNYALSITSYYQKSTTSFSYELPEYSFNYITPLKLGGGLSYVFGKNGFIGAEYMFTNNMGTTIDLKEAGANRYVNNILHNEQLNTHTFKIGGELAYEIFRLRGGYNYTTGPVNPAYQFRKTDGAIQTFSGGIGIRGKSLSFDLSYVRSQFREYAEFYGISKESFGLLTLNSQNQVVGTLNYRF